MIVVENECVDCGLPCIGSSCKYFAVTRYYCDECDEEGKLYEFDNQELCLDCIAKRLDIVEGSDIYV
jgi:hypothetical protein